MLRALDLINVGPAPQLHLELGQRLNVFAGDNGLGKSFILDVIWWALSGTWAELPAWPRPDESATPRITVRLDEATSNRIWPGQRPDYVTTDPDGIQLDSSFDFSEQQWKPSSFAYTQHPLPALIIYARTDGGFAIWDPARNHFKVRPKQRWGVLEAEVLADPATLRRPPAYIFTQNELWNGLELHGRIICNGLIRDWVSWQQQRPESTGGIAFDLLCQTLEMLAPRHGAADEKAEHIRPGPPTRVFVDDARYFPTIDMGYGNLPVIHASAGVKRILGLAYLLAWAYREHVEASTLLHEEPVKNIVFLMDEVELHLHPEWQRRIVPALLKVLEGLSPSMKVQAYLTTHAPLVLASVEPLFDREKDNLFVFDLENGTVTLNELPWAKQGDATDWLLSPAFKLRQARSPEAERAIEDAEAFMRGEEPVKFKTREAIDAELHRVLGGDDTFWPRWIGALSEPEE